MKQDFDFLSRIVAEFFAQPPIRDTLSEILQLEISGWEKWVQVEFAKFCHRHTDISECGREVRYELDRRMSRARSSCAIDFLIRQKHKHSPLGIEIKQHGSPHRCIKAMFSDLEKIRKIKYSQDNLRGIWCLGIHSAASPQTIDELILRHANDSGIEIDPALVFSQQIGATGFSVTLL